MNEKEFKHIAKQNFKDHFGLTLLDIKPTNLPTPDFECLGDKNSFLIELKIKKDDPAELASIKAELKTDNIVSRETPSGRRNTLYGIISKGVEQMVLYDQNAKYFHVLWIHCSGSDPNFHHTRFKATLFGTQDLFSLRVEPKITCYYFHNSSFFKYKDNLDGVILTTESSMQLCINSLSSRVEAFRSSELTEAFRRKQYLHDPDTYSNDADFMIVDCDIDRNNKNEVLNYLMKKHELDHLQTIDLKKHEGFLSIKNST